MIGFPPRTPFLIFDKHQGGSALCGARPEALPLDSTTFEKVDENFKRAERKKRPLLGAFFHTFSISAMSSSTSRSRVAQLVQKRTARCVSSTRAQSEKV